MEVLATKVIVMVILVKIIVFNEKLTLDILPQHRARALDHSSSS